VHRTSHPTRKTRGFTKDFCEEAMRTRSKCEEMRMGTMGTENAVRLTQMARYCNRDSFLPGSEMDRTTD